ncbi:class B sortase [Lacrimispora sp.]|uniref:class B sortase n=1 Tax=Lacrimispora sp. TaxID=2719234 RepID=UPI0039E5E7C0
MLTHMHEYREGSKEYQELNRILWKSQTETGKNVDRNILFEDSLKQINPDYIFWLSIPGTSVDYPVAKSLQPGYYLNHTFQGNENPCGSLFMQEETDPINEGNTVIFGHNMKNGSMFADLKHYKNKDFYEDHKTLYIYHEGKRHEGVIFSCQIRSEEELECYQTEFSTPTQKHEFINHMKASSLYTIPISLPDQASIITLSTCYGSSERMIVQAALVCYTE